MSDPASARLPRAYPGLTRLQEEFERYQSAAFPERPPRFFALELCGEAGELANLEKKVWKGRPVADERFADEIADVVIAALNYANSRNIDLGGAVGAKMEEIDRRRLASGPSDEATFATDRAPTRGRD